MKDNKVNFLEESEEDDIVLKTINNIENKYINLMDFITKHKCEYGDKTYTHTWWDNSKNILFKVDSDEYEIFLEVYSKEVKTRCGFLHVMEKPLDIGPLYFDYDVKFTEKIRCFDKININSVIETINGVIKFYYKVSDNDLTSYVLIKEKPYWDENKKLYSDGFHVHYPNLTMDVKDRFLIFEKTKGEILSKGHFDELIKLALKHNLEEETGKKYIINDNDDFIDENNEKPTKLVIKKLFDQIITELFDSSIIRRNSWFLYSLIIYLFP